MKGTHRKKESVDRGMEQMKGWNGSRGGEDEWKDGMEEGVEQKER